MSIESLREDVRSHNTSIAWDTYPTLAYTVVGIDDYAGSKLGILAEIKDSSEQLIVCGMGHRDAREVFEVKSKRHFDLADTSPSSGSLISHKSGNVSFVLENVALANDYYSLLSIDESLKTIGRYDLVNSENLSLRGLLNAREYFKFDRLGLKKLAVPKSALSNHMLLYGNLLAPLESVRLQNNFDFYIDRHSLTPEQTELYIEAVTLRVKNNNMHISHDQIIEGIKKATNK
jgi:hypothetical protein